MCNYPYVIKIPILKINELRFCKCNASVHLTISINYLICLINESPDAIPLIINDVVNFIMMPSLRTVTTVRCVTVFSNWISKYNPIILFNIWYKDFSCLNSNLTRNTHQLHLLYVFKYYTFKITTPFPFVYIQSQMCCCESFVVAAIPFKMVLIYLTHCCLIMLYMIRAGYLGQYRLKHYILIYAWPGIIVSVSVHPCMTR